MKDKLLQKLPSYHKQKENQTIYTKPQFQTASLIAQLVNNPHAMPCRRPRFNSWVGKIHWKRDRLPTPVFLGFPCGSAGKESAWQCGSPGFDPWVGKIPWRRERLPIPVFWPGESRGLWGFKESDTTERLSLSQFQILDNRQLESVFPQKNEETRWPYSCPSLLPGGSF